MPDGAEKPQAERVCEWCAAIDNGNLWIPFRVGKFCPRHAQIWMVAAEAALGFVTGALTRAKMEHLLKECRKESLAVKGIRIAIGPKGQNVAVRIEGGEWTSDPRSAKEEREAS